MTIEQTAIRLAEIERDIRVLTGIREDLLTQLIQEREARVTGMLHQTAERPEDTGRFRVPGFLGPKKKDAGMSTVLLSSTGALSHLSQPAPCPEWCCIPESHRHFADGTTVIEERRERSLRHNR